MWGDDWFELNGNDLYQAEVYIRNYVKRWSRCDLMTKEKYGTIRYQQIFVPGTAIYWTKADKFLAKLFGSRTKTMSYSIKTIDTNIIMSVHTYQYPRVLWHTSWLCNRWRQYGKWVLKKAVYSAVKKWPHLKEEVLEDYEEDYL